MSSGEAKYGACWNEINIEEDKPLWNYIINMRRLNDGGWNVSFKFKCSFCNEIYEGSSSSVKTHLLKVTGHEITIYPKVITAQLSGYKS